MLRASGVVRLPLPYLFTAVSAVLATAACGSKASSPLGPSPIDSPSQATATIRGTVETGVSASGVGHSGSGASAAGIRVSVVGTTLSSMTDGSGQFTIEGVPASGSIALRFEGPNLDARLDLSGLTPGQVLTIAVKVSGDHVVLAGSDDPSPSPSSSPGPGHEGEVEFQGAVQSVNPPDLVVDGRLVHTDDATDIKSHGDVIALSAVPVGSTVEIEGTSQSDGSVLARKIRLEDGNDENDDDQGDDNGGQGGDDNDDAGGGNSGSGGGDDGSGHH
jgi:hypothetical protein